MRVTEAADAADFLERSYAVRAAEPVLTNVLGSIAAGAAAGRSYDRERWLLVEDDDGRVVAVAGWTSPYRLLLGPMTEAAASALGRFVAGLPERPPGVIGRPDVVAAAVAAAGWATAPRMDERLLVLGDPVPAPPVPGAPRPATEDDLALGAAWMRLFSEETGSLVPDPDRAFAARLGSAWFWEVDGVPVAYASHAPLVESPAGAVARVGPVYTGVEHRRRGYGAAVTWAVVEQVLPRATTVMLFTDAANPTSNAVYERLGFREVARIVDLDVL